MILHFDQYHSKERDICIHILDQFSINIIVIWKNGTHILCYHLTLGGGFWCFCRAAIDKKLGAAVMTIRVLCFTLRT